MEPPKWTSKCLASWFSLIRIARGVILRRAKITRCWFRERNCQPRIGFHPMVKASNSNHQFESGGDEKGIPSSMHDRKLFSMFLEMIENPLK